MAGFSLEHLAVAIAVAGCHRQPAIDTASAGGGVAQPVAVSDTPLGAAIRARLCSAEATQATDIGADINHLAIAPHA